MSYMNAKATTLLASHCCVCGLPLVDAKSVELGIGPVCRKKYLIGDGITEDARHEANSLVYAASGLYGQGCTAEDVGDILKIVDRLTFLGFAKLGERIAYRFVPIRLEVEDDVEEVRWDSRTRQSAPTGKRMAVVNVWTPFSEKFNTAIRGLSYRNGVRDSKRGFHWQFARSDSRKLLAILSDCFPGYWAIGDKGGFQIPIPGAPAPQRDNTPRGVEPILTFNLAAFHRRRQQRVSV